MYAIFNVVMTCIYWELATKVDSEMHIQCTDEWVEMVVGYHYVV